MFGEPPYRLGMSRFLLLGAGFTRNWGGPLASEMFNLLIGLKPINQMPVLREALVRHRDRGGFEAAIGEIQAEYERSRSPQSLAHLRGFQDAIAEVFSDLDTALSNATFEFQAPPENSGVFVKFLTAFDAIFSLNQDLMLERHYLHHPLNVTLASGNRWNGWEFPGMRVQPPNGPGLPDPAKDRWSPKAPAEFRVSPNLQPVFKLHGSTTWFDEAGQIMVMGYNKLTTIQSQHILRYYNAELERCLSLPSARLVVIGYGFQDTHITTGIRRMISASGRMFIIDPLGVDVTDENRNLTVRLPNDFLNIIDGASTRPLREIFGGPSADYANLMRFLGLHR